MQEAMKAIANPHRQEILRLVWDRELTSSEIASQFELTWPTVSFNLKVLREAGLVRERRDGTRRLYSADRKALRPVEALLRELWRGKLQKLGELAEREARQRRRKR
jgi:DNA-binding transcriptional ArsR family regulator